MKLNTNGLKAIRTALPGTIFAALVIGGQWILVSRFGARSIALVVSGAALALLAAVYVAAWIEDQVARSLHSKGVQR